VNQTLAVVAALLASVACSSPSRERSVSPDPREPAHLAVMDPGGSSPVDLSIKELEKRVTDLPDKADGWIALGRVWVRKARESADPVYYLPADACAQMALHIAPDNAPASELRGLLLLSDHKFRDAEQALQALVGRHPDDATALGLLSDSLVELGRYDEAARQAQQMMDLKPNLPAYSRASYLQWLHGDVAAAKESIRLAIDSGGDSRDPEPLAWVTVQAAMIFWNEGDYEGARAGFDRALQVFPGFPPALVGEGRVALARGDPGAAAALLQRAFRLSPLTETAGLWSDACKAAGDAECQKSAEEATLKQGAADPRTLALFLTTHGLDAERALALADSERVTRDDIYTEDVYGWSLFRVGRLAEARTASDRAIALGTPDARLLYHAGAIRMAQGELADGRKLLRRALKMNPAFGLDDAAEAKRLLGG
jgi:tetratricopeptide (TPR) repeat protein